ncbi:hypothetical protein ACFSR9_06720 [Deinococcus taklimakanensis]|uniref:Uncharacterized protein n=1 Tax=Deinococcus taklimakanensis TaxID=536443 RepID=A0ABW5P402_9DEIO
MRKQFVVGAALFLSTAAGQAVSTITTTTPAQQAVISRNAQAFTGRSCQTYKANMREVPAGMNPKERLSFAFNFALNALKGAGITPKVQRTPDGGGILYVASMNEFAHVTTLQSGGRTYQGTFSCLLK